MIMRRIALCVAVAGLMLGATAAHGMQVVTQDGVIKGRIFDSSTGAGIPAMTVKLKPPKATSQPERATRTDSEGNFDFGKLTRGRYLLEVYSGRTLLHRRVIDSTTDTQFEVRLRRRRS